MLSVNHLMAGNVFSSILNVFNKLGTFAGDLSGSLQNIFFVSLAIFVISIVICILCVTRTYESRLLKSVTGFNRYFKKNPHITEENLVEVNSQFKQVPKTLRYSWQEYMLNRDRQPSEYINSVTCIDQPTRSSAYKNISNTVLFITIMISVLTFFANLACNYAVAGASAESNAATIDTVVFISGVFPSLLIPLLFVFIGLFVVTILKLMESSRYADLYYEFHEFERYLNKACSTMPAFVDYEVLFTPREIREAIPVLQEYLEKRALEEQKEAEEAEMTANHFEKFDFEPVGVESALLLDRAMSEGERYFNFKRGLTERITSKEQEMFNYQKKFDEVTKEFERKSQAVRENMTSLTEQLNATSVKIEANYLKKRYNEEQQKQQQLEKDYEYAQSNFAKQQQELESEINQLSDEIKEKKSQVETNMMSECRNYSNKVWGEINRTLQAQQEPIIREKEEQAAVLQEEIDRMTILVADQDAEIRAKQDYVVKLEQDIKTRLAEIEAINNVRDYFNTPEFRERVSDKKKKRKHESDDDMDEPEQNSLAKIVTTDDPETQIQVEGNQLIEKLKEANEAESPYKEAVDAAHAREQVKMNQENNPFATFASLSNDIEKENEAYLNNQKDLAESVEDTIKAVNEDGNTSATSSVVEENTTTAEPVSSPKAETNTSSSKTDRLKGMFDALTKRNK